MSSDNKDKLFNELVTLLDNTVTNDNKNMIINYLKFMKSQNKIDEKKPAYAHINIKQIGLPYDHTVMYSFNKDDPKYIDAFKAFVPKKDKEYCVYSVSNFESRTVTIKIGDKQVSTSEELHFLEYTNFTVYTNLCERKYIINLNGVCVEEDIFDETTGKITCSFYKNKNINISLHGKQGKVLSYYYKGDTLTDISNEDFTVTKKDNTYVITSCFSIDKVDDRVSTYIRDFRDNKRDVSMFHMAK